MTVRSRYDISLDEIFQVNLMDWFTLLRWCKNTNSFHQVMLPKQTKKSIYLEIHVLNVLCVYHKKRLIFNNKASSFTSRWVLQI